MDVNSTSYSPASRSVIWMPFVVVAGVMAALYLVFFFAPVEREMGGVQRIFYFHVASAIASLILFIGCAVASLSYLRARSRSPYLAGVSDRLAHAFGEIGVIMGLIVLITGPLWAKPAWGYFWSFEPRLNLMLLTVFIFIGYLVVRRQTSTTTRQLSAGIAVAGAVAVPFIHWAIELFGQDSHPNDIINSEDGMHPDMRIAFLVSVLAILVLASYLIWWRYRHHRQRDQVEELFLRVSELEDGI